MRILDVSPRVCFPPDQGSSVRTFNLVRELSRAHQVRQFSQAKHGRLSLGADGDRAWSATDLWVTGTYREVRHSNRAAVALGEPAERNWVGAPVLSGLALELTRPRALREFLRWAELVMVEFPWQFGYCARRRPDLPLVYASHNVERLKFRSYARAAGVRLRGNAWLTLIERSEAAAVARADLIVAVREQDSREFIDGYGADPARVVLVPNGADVQRYRPVDAGPKAAAKRRLGLPDKPTVIFAGSRIPPNRPGLTWVRRLAAAERRFTFLAIGSVAARPTVEDNLVVTGFVPDTRPYLAAADIALVPVEHGGGTKIKLLEGLAAGLPTIAFPEAVEGLAVRDREHVLVAEKSLESLLESLRRLSGEPALAAGIGGRARDYVCEHHDWSRVAQALERALRGVRGETNRGS
jgi:glycosyltransferase involved in cell wall biosynthesis